jgi:hypothetical protein
VSAPGGVKILLALLINVCLSFGRHCERPAPQIEAQLPPTADRERSRTMFEQNLACTGMGSAIVGGLLTFRTRELRAH